MTVIFIKSHIQLWQTDKHTSSQDADTLTSSTSVVVRLYSSTLYSSFIRNSWRKQNAGRCICIIYVFLMYCSVLLWANAKSDIFKWNLLIALTFLAGTHVSTPLWTNLDLLDQCQRVVPHLDGSWELAGQRHSQHHAVGGCGKDAAQDDAFTECMRNDGRHDDQDGRKEVRGAVEVTQRTDLPRQRHLVPEEGRRRWLHVPYLTWATSKFIPENHC